MIIRTAEIVAYLVDTLAVCQRCMKPEEEEESLSSGERVLIGRQVADAREIGELLYCDRCGRRIAEK